jgi:hypothetical protein
MKSTLLSEFITTVLFPGDTGGASKKITSQYHLLTGAIQIASTLCRGVLKASTKAES